MERVMGGGVPLVLGGLGLVLLYRLLQRLQQGTTIQDTVVVITGASSGLGRGECYFGLENLMSSMRQFGSIHNVGYIDRITKRK